MEDYLNDNNAQMWFEPDTINIKREARHTNTYFSNGYLEDSNMVGPSLGLPKREEAAAVHLQENQVDMESIVSNFNYSASFLSQIPPPPAVNYNNTATQLPYSYETNHSSSHAWDLPLSSYFDFSGNNRQDIQPKHASYYEHQDERTQFEQQGYGQQWYNPCNPTPTPSEYLQREFNGSVQDQKYLDTSGPPFGNSVAQDSKFYGGNAGRGVYVSRNLATPGCLQKKRFFQVLQTPNINKGISQFKTMVPPNTRIIKILHASSGSQDTGQQLNKTTNRVPPIKIWKDGNTSSYMTTVMSLCGQTKNFFHQAKETPPPQSTSDVHVTATALASKTFAPTSAVMVTTDVPQEDEAPPAPDIGGSPVQPAPVFKNTIYGYKKLKFRCNVCAYREATLGSLITHVKAHGFPYCVLCALVLATPKQLSAHVRKVHPSIELPEMVTVTSKYGRKRYVLSSVAFAQNRLYPKRQTKNEKEEDIQAKKGSGNSQNTLKRYKTVPT